ncbi:MAG: CDP-alcohol phosphatidyltransferase family protein [bacterium]|nr:CDP-alcohol phosphatidyltransferase family protein [bacterium]
MIFPSFRSTEYIHAHKIYASDRLLALTLLPFLPASVTPNHITMVRFIGTPFVLALLLLHQYTWGVPLFLILALTDAMDGALARTKGRITDWGRMFDPLADKFLIIPTVLILAINFLDVYLAFAVVGVELLIIVAAIAWRKEGRIVQANWWGKIKMLLQVTGVVALLCTAWLGWPLVSFASCTLLVSIFFAIMSLIRYGA